MTGRALDRLNEILQTPSAETDTAIDNSPEPDIQIKKIRDLFSETKSKGVLDTNTSDAIASRLNKKLESRLTDQEKNEIQNAIADLQWESRLKNKQHLFATDKLQGTTYEQHQNKFEQLNFSEKLKTLAELDKYINSYERQFQELYQRFGIDKNVPQDVLKQFKAMGRKKRELYLDKINKLDEKFNKLKNTEGWEKMSSKEQNFQEKIFKNLGPEKRKALIETLSESFNQKSQLDKDYNALRQLDKEQQIGITETISNFESMSETEKNEALRTMRTSLIQYIHKQYADVKDIMPEQDQISLNIWLPKTPNIDLVFWVNNIESTKNTIKKIYAEKYKLIEEISKENGLEKEAATNMFKEIMDHFDIKNKYAHQILELYSNKSFENYKNQIELREHFNEDLKYEEQLKNMLKPDKNGLPLLNKKGADAYRKWYRMQNLDKKQKINGESPETHDFLFQSKATREKNNIKFAEFNKNIFNEHKEKYINAGFEERSQMLIDIEQKALKLNSDYAKHMDELITKELFSKRSKAEYEEWFNQLSLKDKAKMLKSSDLDKPQRQQVLDDWKKVLNYIPEGKKKKLHKEFLEADLTERDKLTIKYGEKYYNDEKAGRNIKTEVHSRTINGETINDELITQQQIELFTSKGNKAKTEGQYTKAIILFEEAMNLTNNNHDSESIKELQKLIAESKRLEEIQLTDGVENPLNHEIEKAVTNALNLPKIKPDRQKFSLLFGALRGAKISCIKAGGNYNAEQRIDKNHQESSQPKPRPIPLKIDSIEPNNKNYPEQVHQHLYNMRNTDPRDQQFDQVQFIDNNGNELLPSEMESKIINPEELALKKKLAELSVANLQAKVPNQPDIQKRLLELTTAHINKLDPTALTIQLEERRQQASRATA